MMVDNTSLTPTASAGLPSLSQEHLKLKVFILASFKIPGTVANPKAFVDFMLDALDEYSIDVLRDAANRALLQEEWLPSVALIKRLSDDIEAEREAERHRSERERRREAYERNRLDREAKEQEEQSLLRQRMQQRRESLARSYAGDAAHFAALMSLGQAWSALCAVEIIMGDDEASRWLVALERGERWVIEAGAEMTRWADHPSLDADPPVTSCEIVLITARSAYLRIQAKGREVRDA